MHSNTFPRVRDGALRCATSTADEQSSVLVGSAEWYDRLDQIASFGFEDQSGRSFTARREQREQQWYWYAYRKCGKKLRKVYLGKTAQLEPARLQQAARELANLLPEAEPDPASDSHTQSSAGSRSAGQAADTSLRFTKLRMPALPGNLLQRPRLTQHLRRSLEQHPPQTLLTVITAPAGYGKSTLLSEWLNQIADRSHSDQRSTISKLQSPKVAWLSLDPEDNDPQQFWRSIIAALRSSAPALGQRALPLLRERQPARVGHAVTALLNDLQLVQHSLVLVLDDYHIIDTPTIHDSFADFLAHCPACLHVVISSRTLPPLPFGRLRLRCDVAELQAADLRLTDEEGFALLSRDPRLAEQPSAIAQVLRKTEGWIVGVHLFLLALQHHGDLDTALAELDGNHQYLTEYVVEQVLRQQSPAMQTVLLHTAILEDFNGSLCEAVTGLPNGQQMVQRIEQANLFLSAVDQRPGWYRYYHLFAQALRHMLDQVYPNQVPALHRRAASWYLERHAIGDALRHLFAGGAFFEAAQLLEQYGMRMLQGGHVAALLRGLQELPHEVLREHEALLVLKARTLMLAGELNALEAYLEQLETSSAAESVVQEVVQIRSMLSTSAATTSSPPVGEHTLWESLDAFTRSMHSWSQLDTEASYAAAAHALEVGQASGLRSVSLLAASTLAWIHIVRGELRAALRLAHDALALDHTTEAAVLAGACQPNPATGPLFLALGVIYYERNRLELAHQCLEQALALTGQLGRQDYLFAAHALLARALGAGKQQQAAYVLLQAGLSRARTGRMSFWPEADMFAYQAWIWLHTGELAQAAQWAQIADVRLDDRQIAQRRTEYWVYAEVLLAQGQYAQAASLLGQLVQSATQVGTQTEPLLKLLVAYASALFAQGQGEAALQVLALALDRGQAEGYIRPFLDIAPQHTRALLVYAYQKTRMQPHIEAYLHQLLSASDHGPFSVGLPTEATPLLLSRREREILRLVEGGLSNPEIAHKLVIEVNTVKSHLHHIYQRLGVRTRYQAVMQAKTLQLLV